jgi:3-carboxy-cis,cis-muconate cycloisomerase
MSSLWDPIFGMTEVVTQTDDRAWLGALGEVEAALARACARCGVISSDAAQAIVEACREVVDLDPADLGERAAADGNPVIPLVRDLRARVPDHADAVHRGATSQDILDTASMLVAQRSLTVVLNALNDAASSCRRLALDHRGTPMAARTLLQQALPTTFGAVVAGWGEGIESAYDGLAAVRAGLAVQLGGAAGTLAALYPNGPAVRAALAADLGLTDPGTVWHTERSRISVLAGALGTTCGVLAKIATDVVLLAQTELGEVGEQAGGSSSSMAHKHNPIAAVTARAAAAQAPGLVATLLASMPGELQRGAGPWHAEWQPLNALLATTGGAATRLAVCLSGLRVDPDAMAANLTRMPGYDVSSSPPDTGHATDLVDDYLRRSQR